MVGKQKCFISFACQGVNHYSNFIIIIEIENDLCGGEVSCGSAGRRHPSAGTFRLPAAGDFLRLRKQKKRRIVDSGRGCVLNDDSATWTKGCSVL